MYNRKPYRFSFNFIAGPCIGFEVYGDANDDAAFVIHLLFFRIFYNKREDDDGADE